MDRETLIEQAKQFAFFTGKVVYDDTWVRLMATFAAKIRDEAAIEQLAAVTAERDELKSTLNEFALEVIGQYGYVIGNQFRTGGESTIEYAFRILGWDDPHNIEGETDNG